MMLIDMTLRFKMKKDHITLCTGAMWFHLLNKQDSEETRSTSKIFATANSSGATEECRGIKLHHVFPATQPDSSQTVISHLRSFVAHKAESSPSELGVT